MTRSELKEEFDSICKDAPDLVEVERMVLQMDRLMENATADQIWSAFIKKWMQALVGYHSYNPKVNSTRDYDIANIYLHGLVEEAQERIEAKRIAAQ